MTYELQEGTFKTPRGRSAAMAYRADSSDWNTLWSCMNEDEYDLASLTLTGAALDIGAHVGGVTIGLAIDNPDLRVIAVEPVPPNAELLRGNLARNGIGDRVTVIENAAGGKEPVTVWYGYKGTEAAEHHAFIGNSSLAYAKASKIEHDTIRYQHPWTLSRLLELAGPVSLLKIDCEGGEYAVLADPAVAKVPLILGEWHPVRGRLIPDVLALLEATHDVTFSGPEAGPGGFVAVAR
jgi:FkbM family methyltransferase